MLTAVVAVATFKVVGVGLGAEAGTASRWGFIMCFKGLGSGADVS